MACTHEIWEMDDATYDGFCPLCMAEELTEARKDAARLNWMEANAAEAFEVIERAGYATAPDWKNPNYRAAIDEAMK